MYTFKNLTTPTQTTTGGQGIVLAALTIACIGVFFTALDQTVVVTALPQIIADLQIPIIQLDHASWIVSAYGIPLMLPAIAPAAAPDPPTPDSGSNSWRNWNNVRNTLVLLLMSLGIFATLTWDSSSTAGPGTPTAIAGFRMIQLALDSAALTWLFTSEPGLQHGALTDLRVTLAPNDGLILSLNLHIDANGIHRVMPIELDSTIGLDNAQNIQVHVLHLKRDGLDAGPTAAATMQKGLNQLLLHSVMPALRGQLKSAKLISVHTSSSTGCPGAGEVLVLLIQAPPIQGIAAQPTPITLCLKGPIDAHKLLS